MPAQAAESRCRRPATGNRQLKKRMAKEMLINVSEGEECRIALVNNRRLEELYMERTSATSHVGNIYKGRVTNVEPSIQAAFIDFGLGRNGFLHISDLMPQYFGRRGDDYQESVGRKMARRDRPPIQKCLRRGDDIVVQIIKEGIGTKGPTLSTYVSIPGRILVMMPGMSKLGVSRKIEDEEERRRLRQILDALKPPRDCGFIIRTAGIGKTKAEIQKDLNYLTRLWQNIEQKIESGPGPIELYTEGDLVTRTVRDVFTADIERIIVDNKEVARRVKEFMKIALPRTRNKLDLYEEAIPLFHKYGIEKEIELMYSRHVPLPSGGSLVIDSTEAIVAIDVNSGKFRDHSDAEMTAFKTDIEAADEIPRQLRLRDLGGVIICDFIDLRYERHRRDLEKRLHDNLRNDRAKTKMLRMSQFGIIEMTRQRMRPSLKRSIYSDCPYCKGAGLVKTPESMALDVMRRLAIAASDDRIARIDLAINPDVAFYLQNKKRAALAALENQTGKRIVIRSDGSLGLDASSLVLYDARDGMVFLEELGMAPPSQQVQPGVRSPYPVGQRSDSRRDRGPGRDRDRRDRGRGHPQPQQPPPHREMPHEEAEEFDIENMEDAVEERETELLGPQADREAISPPPQPMDVAQDESTRPLRSDADDRAVAARKGTGGNETRHAAAPERTPLSDDKAPPATTRSRRRGRRGRGGRSRAPAQSVPGAETSASTPDAVIAEPPPKAMPEPEARPEEPIEPAQPARVARSRGVRRGRSTRAPRRPSSQPHQPEPAGAQPPAAVVRTGSTDRHLIEDEPVLPQPVSRPKTYRDLDSIPDDFD